MIATIVDWATIGKVALYSLAFGVGVAVIVGLGISSAAGLQEAMRRRSAAASVAWGLVAAACVAAACGAIVLGVAVMSSSKG
jgi:hypothetical protein